MPCAVLTIPDEVKLELKRFSWVNWSNVVRDKLIKSEEIEDELNELRRIVAKSKLTQEQADKLSDETNWSLAKRYHKLISGEK